MASKLNERLASKLTEQGKDLDEYTDNVKKLSLDSLMRLAKDLQSTSNSAVDSIESTLKDRLQSLSSELGKVEKRQSKWWLWTGAGCLIVLVLTGTSVYGLASYKMAEVASLKIEIKALETTRSKLELWGLESRESDTGKFILLPVGQRWDQDEWTFGNQRAVRIEE